MNMTNHQHPAHDDDSGDDSGGDALRSEIYRLAELRLAGGLSLEEVARLTELIAQNMEAAKLYVEFMQDAATLYDVSAAAMSAGVKKSAPATGPLASITEHAIAGPRRVTLRRMWVAAITIAASLLAAVFMARGWLPSVRQDAQTLPPGPVAQLTRTVGARWQDGAQSHGAEANGKKSDVAPLPRALALGEKLQLLSGLAEIEYATGAKVIVQGPAEYVVGLSDIPQSTIHNPQSLNSGFFAYGKLTAHVPPKAVGFTIASPEATVTDLGTEFGLTVAQSSRDTQRSTELDPAATEVHVLDGRVQVTPSIVAHESEMRNQKSEILSAGQALRITLAAASKQSATTPLPAAPEQFVRNLSGPEGTLVYREDWEQMVRGEPIENVGEWREKYQSGVPPLQLIYVERDDGSVPAIFGRRSLRFDDQNADPRMPNVFAYRSMPPEIQGRALTVRFDFRALSARCAPLFGSLGGHEWRLRLAPELAVQGQPPIARIETGRWYRLTLDIPASSSTPAEIGLGLEKLSGDRFVALQTARRTAPPRLGTDRSNPQTQETLYLGFMPRELEPLGGTWELDNLEIWMK